MEDLIYTMVLSDGTIIENLRKNGDNYISASKLTADMFEGKLSEVTVKTSENEVVMENMDLVQITEMDGEYWFVLRQFSATELAMAKMSSNIDFLAMMQDVELKIRKRGITIWNIVKTLKRLKTIMMISSGMSVEYA